MTEKGAEEMTRDSFKHNHFLALIDNKLRAGGNFTKYK